MKTHNLLSAAIISAKLLLIISVALAIGMVITNDTKEIPMMFGAIGLIGFAFLFFAGFIDRKTRDEQEKLDAVYYLRLVEYLKDEPKRFNKEFKRLIGSGTSYLLLLFVFIFLSFVGIIAIGVWAGRSFGGFGVFAAGLIAVVYTVVKSLYIKYEPAEGYVINEDTAPEVFRIIHSARQKTGAPELQKVFVGYDANCGVSQNPLGFGFKTENLLYIGIYLLIFLSEKELEAIFVHEFAHMYNKDTETLNKIIRNIIRWSKILENCETKGVIANALLKNFGENYIVKMQMYSHVVSKEKEILADKEAAKYMGGDIYAKVSMKIEMLEYFFNRSLEENQVDIRTLDEPPKDFYSFMAREFIKNYTEKKEKWKSQILKRISNKADTHPSYKERMDKIGIADFDFTIDFNPASSQEVSKIIHDFNAEWYWKAYENWDDYTDDYKKKQEIVKEYRLGEDNEKNMEYAMALEELSKSEEALTIYDSILAKDEKFAPALYRSGLIYLNRNDEKGLELVRRAMELDNDFIDAGLGAIGTYLDANGLKDKKEEIRDWALEKSEIYKKKTDEAENLYPNDVFVEAKISAEQREELKQRLEVIASIKRVFVASKELAYSDYDLLIVAVISRQGLLKKSWGGSKLYDIEAISEVLNSMDLPYFLLDIGENVFFAKPLSLVKNSDLIKR